MRRLELLRLGLLLAAWLGGSERVSAAGPWCDAPSCPYGVAPAACDTCCQAERSCWTVQAEYLMWWTRDRGLPPLVTTSPAGTPRDEAGVLGLDDTRVLFGNEPVGEGLRSGGRVTLSRMLDDDGCYFADARIWGLEDSGRTYFNSSDGEPILARPFFNGLLDQEDAQLVAFPGVTEDGRIRVNIHNDLLGAEVAGRMLWRDDCRGQLFLLAGYQFTRLDDSLTIRNVQTSVDPQSALPVNTLIDVQDSFRTHNEFHGGQLGFLATTCGGCWSFDLAGKLALGSMRQRAIIAGRTVIAPPFGSPLEGDAGLLAQATNSGDHQRHRLAFIPQVDVTARYQLNPCWRLTFGYSFLYWSNVLLAADQIDRRINFAPGIGPAVPEFSFRRTDFWAMGMNFGAEYQF
jgi:hypothetical protein